MGQAAFFFAAGTGAAAPAPPKAHKRFALARARTIFCSSFFFILAAYPSCVSSFAGKLVLAFSWNERRARVEKASGACERASIASKASTNDAVNVQ